MTPNSTKTTGMMTRLCANVIRFLTNSLMTKTVFGSGSWRR